MPFLPLTPEREPPPIVALSFSSPQPRVSAGGGPPSGVRGAGQEKSSFKK